MLLLASSSCPHDDTAININCISDGSDGSHESCHLGLKYVIKGICQLVIKLIYWKTILHVSDILYVHVNLDLTFHITHFTLFIVEYFWILSLIHSVIQLATQTHCRFNWAEGFSFHILPKPCLSIFFDIVKKKRLLLLNNNPIERLGLRQIGMNYMDSRFIRS